MFNVKSYSDVVEIAKTFSTDALLYAINNNTLDKESIQVVNKCREWANRLSFDIARYESYVSFIISAQYTREMIGGEYCTRTSDIKIVRTGYGGFELPLHEVIKRNMVEEHSIIYVLETIRERNAAATALGM